jgi:hypothetical protein
MSEINWPNKCKKLNVIKKLKKHKEQEKIISLLNEYNKKQEMDYFLTQNNIWIGKLNPINKYLNDRNQKYAPYSYVGSHYKRPTAIHHTSMRLRNNSLSSSRIVRQRRDSVHINKNNVIDNKSLKNYYNDIRQRISEEKSKNEDKYKLLTEVPYGVRKSLINQENIFRKVIKEKKIKKLMQEKIKKKCNKKNLADLLINQNRIFDKKNQELSIIDKNMTDDNKYRDNFWNITLRNLPYNGNYEKVGYLNVGSNYHPMYTFFNINKNIEYFNKPIHLRNKTEENKDRSYKLYSSLNEDNYNAKMKQNLQLLNSIGALEIKGRNLLDVEDKRESEIKGKKIIYNRQDLDCIIFKAKEKSKKDKEITDREYKTTLDEIYEEKIFATNYRKNDVFKNTNLTSKYSNKI